MLVPALTFRFSRTVVTVIEKKDFMATIFACAGSGTELPDTKRYYQTLKLNYQTLNVVVTVTENEGSVAVAAEYADSGPGLPDPPGSAAPHAARVTGTREDPLAGRKRKGRLGCREFER